MGGTVEKIKNKKGQGIGPYRVWIKNKDYPGLAMSRSIGDFHGKKVGVIADPEIIECNLSIHSKFITICSDGVWEFLNNDDVMNIGKKFYLENNPRGFCKELISKSVQYWEKEDSAACNKVFRENFNDEIKKGIKLSKIGKDYHVVLRLNIIDFGPSSIKNRIKLNKERKKITDKKVKIKPYIPELKINEEKNFCKKCG